MTHAPKSSVIGAVIAGLILLWIVSVSFASVLLDGTLFRMSQPVQVIMLSDGSVTLATTSTVGLDMQGESTRYIHCGDYAAMIGQEPVLLRRGVHHSIKVIVLPGYIVKSFPGDSCYITGHVVYDPFGRFGPQLDYWWQSGPFDLPNE